MVNESQKAALLLGTTATIGAYVQSKGYGSSIAKYIPAGTFADFVLGLALVAAGIYFDGEFGDYAIAFGTGYALSSIL